MPRELPDAVPPGRRELLATGVAGAAIVGLAGLGARAAWADQALDVQLLQTAASIENVLVTTYESVLTLPVLNTSGTTRLRDILGAARTHHADHARAFNDAAGRLGGRPQTGANPALAQTAGRRLGDLSQILDLAHELETAAAQTYQNDVGLLGDLDARKLTASILAVESQHAAVLLVARALLTANVPDLINLEAGALARFPAETGQAGTPEPFTTVDQARPAGEGAVR